MIDQLLLKSYSRLQCSLRLGADRELLLLQLLTKLSMTGTEVPHLSAVTRGQFNTYIDPSAVDHLLKGLR